METSPGWKTTEFWIALLLPPIIGVVNSIFGLGLDPTDIAQMFGITLPAYVVSRGIAKHGVSPTKE